ncbi:MAG TPA: YeeE/YedE family protein [Pseudomonadales bacterium]|nr:YeeE/YedE family protein [Pseudomonadales bacterium]
MHNFTPLAALSGGLLIGLSSILLLWLNGRLAGISSIAGRLLLLQRDNISWRIFFLLGLVGGAAVYYTTGGHEPVARPQFPAWLLVLAGFLVGFGTSLANGCTSGHGVCGLARLSLRSFTATLTFLLTGIITTYVVRHVIGWI